MIIEGVAKPWGTKSLYDSLETKSKILRTFSRAPLANELQPFEDGDCGRNSVYDFVAFQRV